MQELVILLSSIAGAASAVAIKKFPKDTRKIQSIGSSKHIRNQINSLKLEKEIINKTIARLYDENSNLSKLQKDRLLLRYQHQLGIILAKLDKLEIAKQHPDLGPIGDGLITLMDQKLSHLDNRLFELSSKITILDRDEKESAQKTGLTINQKENPEKEISLDNLQKTSQISKIEIPKPRKKSMEITTLTNIPRDIPKYPFEEKVELDKNDETVKKKEEPKRKEETVDNSTKIKEIVDLSKKELPKLPTPIILPKPEELKEKPKTASNDTEDDDDLEKIKGEILKTLSKLEQAEVE